MADRIMKALGAVLTDDAVRTRDLGGTASTTEFTERHLPPPGGVRAAPRR